MASTRNTTSNQRTRLIASIFAIGFALAGRGEAAAARGNKILGIYVEAGRDQLGATNLSQRQVRIVTSSEPTFTVFRLSNPMRVVVDISGGDLSALETPIIIEDGVIGHIAARQFSADGFLVGRVVVGFEMDLSYSVRAEGNAVVVRTGRSPAAIVDRAIPPPVAPIDRAAAERFVTAKREAEAAARHAVDERRLAERTAANARLQQQEAERLASKARQAHAEADTARTEVEKLRQRVQAAAARDRAAVELSTREAERRLKQLQRDAERVAAARSEAERVASAAERARREAEEAAARAEADHKKRKALLKAEIARAAKDKKAAKKAWDRAKAAQSKAEVASLHAERAQREADRHRAEIDKKLNDVSRREHEVAAQRERTKGERAKLERIRAEIAAKDRELEKRWGALVAAGRDVKADRKKIAAARAELRRRRSRLKEEAAAAAASAVEQARREAEEVAARAEADHKKREAWLKAEVARAAKEKKAAKDARDRAKAVQQEAELASRNAERAERQADRHRAEIEKRRVEIAARDREIEKRRAALVSAGHDVEADRKKIAVERAELRRLRERLKKEASVAAEREAERHRTDLAVKLDEISRRERELAEQRESAATQNAALANREAKVRARDHDLEHERTQLEARGRGVNADKKKVATERAKLSTLREKLEQEKTQVASEQRTLDRSRKQIEAQWLAIAAERKSLTQERDELVREQQRLRKRRAKLGGLESSFEQRRANLESDEAALAATLVVADRARKALASAETRIEKQQKGRHKRTHQERRELQQEKARLAKEAKRFADLRDQSVRERRRLAKLREGLAAEQARLGKDRQQLAKDEDRLSHRRRELQRRADATKARATVPVAALIKPERQRIAVASTGTVHESWSSARRGGHASLIGVERRGTGADAKILLVLKGRPEYQVQRIVDPPRLVIDFLDTSRGTQRTTFGVQSTYVRRVRLGDHGSMLRAVLDLSANNAEHELIETADGLLVSLRTRHDQVSHPLHPEAPQQPAKMTDGWLQLRDIRFDGNNDVARIVLDIDRDVTTHIDSRSSKAWVLELENTTVSKPLERSLDTTAYATIVRLVSTYQATPGTVKVVANLTGPATQKLVRENGGLVWEIRALKKAKDKDGRRPIAAAAAPKAAGFAADAAVLARSTPRQSRHKKKISIDLKDADIVNVLRLLSEVSGENIVTSDEVTGKITMRLRNVPWDRALSTILKAKGYDMVREDNILRIAPAEVIQRERERELERRQAKAKVEETVIKIITVNYADASDISGKLKPMLSVRGSVQVDDRTNMIIVEDIRSNIDRIVQLTRRLDRQTPQVLIEARIVEASTNQLEHLGIQWGGTSQQSTVTGNPTGLLFPSDLIFSGAADDQNTQRSGISTPSRYAVNLPAPIGSGSGGGIGFIFGSAGGSQILNLRLTALEESGKGRIISSPRITTLDNRKATISQGVDIPVSVVSAAGVNTRFIQARLKLEVTPHVTNDGSILLKIAASKNEPDFSRLGGAGDPAIIKKEAITEVLVRDGETTVIGGIYTRKTSNVESGIPFLSKIPLLGALFRSSRTEDTRSEMLIFVTPRIVNREASAVQSASLGSSLE